VFEELRVRDRSGAYRVFYYTKLAIDLIFSAFAKETQYAPERSLTRNSSTPDATEVIDRDNGIERFSPFCNQR